MRPLNKKDIKANETYICLTMKEPRSCFNRRRGTVDEREVYNGKTFPHWKQKGYHDHSFFANHFTNNTVIINVIEGSFLLENKNKILWDRVIVTCTENKFNEISDYCYKNKLIDEVEEEFTKTWDKKVMEQAFINGDMSKIDGTLPGAIAKELKLDNTYDRYRIASRQFQEWLGNTRQSLLDERHMMAQEQLKKAIKKAKNKRMAA